MAMNPLGFPANTHREHARQGGCCYSRKRWPYEILTGIGTPELQKKNSSSSISRQSVWVEILCFGKLPKDECLQKSFSESLWGCKCEGNATPLKLYSARENS
ncbi:hypothetical protein PR048_012941 [Dryococelus australis]|uniref:Uncharacterized protein n=1 Tax=Dryococelus australis TaxID=614101 RepID=A0ABQ9HQT3_9NEOP|nr:hypothetical protein PR048_012941 [Dryococelus australis]